MISEIKKLQKILKLKQKINHKIVSSCILCSGKKFQIFTNTTLFGSNLFYINFPYLQCQKCGLIQQKIRLSEKFHHNYYANILPRLQSRGRIREKNLFKNSYLRGKILYKKLSPYFNKGKVYNLLDVGCGSGGVLKAFEEKKWNVYGVDPDKKLVNSISKKISSKNLYSKNFEDIKFKNFFFDLIVVSGSLEHVNNLSLVMKKIEKYSKPKSILFLDAKGYPQDIKENFLNFNHHRLFGPKTMEWLCNKYSFKKKLCNFNFMSNIKYKLVSKNKVKKSNLYYLGIKDKVSKPKYTKETFFNRLLK